MYMWATDGLSAQFVFHDKSLIMHKRPERSAEQQVTSAFKTVDRIIFYLLITK